MTIARTGQPATPDHDTLNAMNPVMETDSEAYQADATQKLVMPVMVVGPVQTQQVPTVSAGSRTETLTAPVNGVLSVAKIASADPRRASVTIVTNQPTYVSNSRAQVELGTAALIPANVGIVISHRADIWVSGPATNTFPMTVAVLIENWAY